MCIHSYYFNSTLVRLKRQRPNVELKCENNFNSTLVRLKRSGYKGFKKIIKFQFHLGTIKTQPEQATEPGQEHFNSTLVRLKQRTEPATTHALHNFNSTLVRLKQRITTTIPKASQFQFHLGTIKTIIAFKTHDTLKNFNSTLVRLKQRRRYILFFSTIFQFHLGTIKTNLPRSLTCFFNISIPPWYD